MCVWVCLYVNTEAHVTHPNYKAHHTAEKVDLSLAVIRAECAIVARALTTRIPLIKADSRGAHSHITLQYRKPDTAAIVCVCV